jgi:fatty acid desaturase
MTQPDGNNPLTLTLIGLWAILLLISFVVGFSWVVISARKYSAAELSKQIMVRGGVLAFLHLLYVTMIALTSNVRAEGVLCLWICLLSLVAFNYGMHYISHRRLQQMEHDQQQKNRKAHPP